MKPGMPGNEAEGTKSGQPGCLDPCQRAAVEWGPAACRADRAGSAGLWQVPAIVREQLYLTFRSLRHGNFRLYCTGQLVSLSGTWMQNLALNWLVFRLTKSAWMLGLVSFASLAPTLILGLAGGWIADRFDRRKIMLCTQTLAMSQSILLAFLTLTHRLEIWQALLLTAFLGSVNAFEIPARQALIVNMVEKEDLVNAVSLNSSLFHSCRTLGPALAGLLVGAVGEGYCFALNAVSYLAALIAIAVIRLPGVDRRHILNGQSESLLAAIRFALTTPSVRDLLALTAVASLFAMQYLMLMPVFASDVLHRQVGALGALTAGAGVGSCLAALSLANRGSSKFLKKGVGWACLAFAGALALFTLSQHLYLSIALVTLVGFFMTIQLSGSHSLLQLAVSDGQRGKLMSIYMMTMMGMVPLGSLIIGWAAHRWGAPNALTVSSAVCAASAFFYLMRR